MRVNLTGRSRLLHADWSSVSALYTGKRRVWIRTARHILQIDIRRRWVVSFTCWSLTSGQRAPNEHEFVWSPGPIFPSSSGGKSLSPAGILPLKGNKGGNRGIGPLFLNVGTRWCERSNSLPSPLYPRESSHHTHYREGWVDSRVSEIRTGEVKIPGLCRDSYPESSRP